jgi:hypothetical protein
VVSPLGFSTCSPLQIQVERSELTGSHIEVDPIEIVFQNLSRNVSGVDSGLGVPNTFQHVESIE